jgi:hypothetical protein
MDPFSEITPAPDWRLTDVALRHADIAPTSWPVLR